MSIFAIGGKGAAYLPLLPAPLAGSGFGFSFLGLRISLVFFCWPFAMAGLLYPLPINYFRALPQGSA
jgi:hypothetical protein